MALVVGLLVFVASLMTMSCVRPSASPSALILRGKGHMMLRQRVVHMMLRQRVCLGCVLVHVGCCDKADLVVSETCPTPCACCAGACSGHISSRTPTPCDGHKCNACKRAEIVTICKPIHPSEGREGHASCRPWLLQPCCVFWAVPSHTTTWMVIITNRMASRAKTRY
jgi:hypothetical protein